jgi:signal transduction histidine kinase/CheY-like chemotaxis protein
MTWVSTIAICDIMFPVAFFFLGGMSSSIIAYFVLSTVVVFLLMSGRSLYIMLLVQAVIVAACYLLGYWYPDFISEVLGIRLSVEQQLSDHYFSYLFIAMFIGLLIVFQTTLFANEQARTVRDNKLLGIVNESAGTLLASDSLDLKRTLETSMANIGRDLDLDRMYIWRNHERNGELCYMQEFSWVRDTDYNRNSLLAMTGYAYHDTIPAWEKSFAKNEVVNGPIHSLSADEQNALRQYGIKSILVIPVILQTEFWGFVSFDDCRDDSRYFATDEVDILRSGALMLASTVLRDTLERERLNALEQAVQASKAKGDFLSNMSHEMRTPMNAIIGMTSIGRSSSDLERKDYALDKIEDASTHLLGVINDILDMSKIEANKLELSIVTFEFEHMLRKVVNVINFRVEERKQQFSVTIDHRIPHKLEGDDQRLAQVITNLLSNAVKFTPEQGSISLSAKLLEENESSCMLQIEVSDTGIGVSEEQKTRLFSSFEQAESDTSRRFGGTGLGLAISKRIVELMAGEIWLESELGKGSTFAFAVRLKHGGQGCLSGLLKNGANWGNLRILVVDDDQGILDFFTDLAHTHEITCDTVLSGARALELIEAGNSYDIYFIDWRMPGMDGLELSRRINSIDNEQSVITMISATEWGMIETDARAAGVDKYLSKPLFPSTVAELINECIGFENLMQSNDERAIERFAGVRILLAEDIEINQEIVLALLEPTELLIDIAENGQIAVEKFAADPNRYSMILMDMQMPEMDGLEATRQIRALDHPRAQAVPIIAMTANVFKEDIERCLVAGMNDHVGKPIDLDELLGKLHRYLLPAAEDSNTSKAVY